MTLEEVKEEIPTLERFLSMACGMCTGNDWYCPSYCHDLEKAKRIPLEKIQQSYARHDGDMYKVIRYIKNVRK